ncbi:MAG: PP2C family protein-serine/threonine phosphatase [Salibacteraceae bacterium]
MNNSKGKKKRDLSRQKVRQILSITNAINNNLEASALFKLFKEILVSNLEIEHVVFFAKIDNTWKLPIHVDVANAITNINVDTDLLRYKDITSLGMVNNKLLDFFDLIIPIIQDDKPLGYLLLKDIEDDANGVSNLIKNLNYIQSLANIIMVAIENKRMVNEQINQAALKRDLILAERIQEALLPATLPSNERIKATAFHQSRGHVGGDYYDLIETRDGIYYFCVADVSGKGISAAMLMSNFQAAFKATIRQNIPIQEVIIELNKIVFESSLGDKFITAFIGKYDSHNRELEYINCAHPPAILFNHLTTLTLDADIPGLGMLTQLPRIEPETYTLIPGTFLTTYTDGISEIENEQGEQFGIDRIIECINTFKGKPLEEFIPHFNTNIEVFIGQRDPDDDIAALNIEFL